MTLADSDLSKLGTLEKAKKYAKIHHQIFFLNLGLTGLLLCLIVFSPLGSWMRSLVDPLTNPYLQLQIYFVIFSIVFLLFDLPLSYYSGFVLEKKFELTNHTLKSWCADEAKKALLSFGIASLLIQVFYLLIRVFPTSWWWISWIVYFAFTLFLTKVMPLWIVPLFYKYGPIESESLKNRIIKLGETHGLHIKNFFSLNFSRTTKKANAMFTGLGKTKRVVLADTLIQNFTEDEIETVLAHEIGHFKKKHILKNVLLNCFSSLILFDLCYLFLNSRAAATGFSASDPMFFPDVALLLWIIGLGTGPFFKWLSRRHETEADTFALRATGDRESFISAFQKLASQNLADPNPNPWIERLLYSHPSISKRIEFARKFQK